MVDLLLWLALLPLVGMLGWLRLRGARSWVKPAPEPVVFEPPTGEENLASRLEELKRRKAAGEVRFTIAAQETTLLPGTREEHEERLAAMLREPVECRLEHQGVVYLGRVAARRRSLRFVPIPAGAALGESCALRFRAGGAAWELVSRIDAIGRSLRLPFPHSVSRTDGRSGQRVGVTGLLTLVREGGVASMPVLDLSGRGLSVRGGDAFRVGERVRVSLLMDGAPLLSATVEVRHVDEEGCAGLHVVGEKARADVREVLQALAS